MKDKELKSSFFGAERRSRLLPLFLIVSSLCAVSFYLGGAFCSEKKTIDETHQSLAASDKAGCSAVIKQAPFESCNITMQDYTPCTDPVVSQLFRFS